VGAGVDLVDHIIRVRPGERVPRVEVEQVALHHSADHLVRCDQRSPCRVSPDGHESLAGTYIRAGVTLAAGEPPPVLVDDLDRDFEGTADNLGRSDRSPQRADEDPVDRVRAKRSSVAMRLLDTAGGQLGVEPTLPASLEVPSGLPMSGQEY
jgi:hypothetical protein